MKRFESLEFDDARGPKKQEVTGEPIRDEEYFIRRGLLYFLAADYEVALRNYSRALEKSHTCYDAWHGQVLMLIELGEYPEAVVWADKALELFPNHPELLAAKAVAYLRDARADKALAFSDNAMSQEKVTSRVWLSRAEVLMKRKSRVARDCVSKAVAASGNMKHVISLEAGRILRQYGYYSPALEYLNAAVQMLPKSALTWYEMGCCQRKLGLPQGAESFRQALDLRPDWEPAKDGLKKSQKRGLLRRVFHLR